ncbi:MAG TPA: cyclopropane-fatty-acyl-phospholipid synthase family protein [Actinomycetes bacterium]|nr:cyclopropane-fatty-acyl-phospholipid synthase family protein [Actinomycetes bacterium]
MPAADRLVQLFTQVLGEAPPLRLRAWDGSEAGPAEGPVLVVRDRRAVRRLVWRPDEVGLGRGYVAGELDVEGDLYEVLTRLAFITEHDDRPDHPLSVADKARVAATAIRLGAVGPEPTPPPEEAGSRAGARHTRSRDQAAISHHYDVGNEFYRHVLGPSMVYSCAYWTRAGDASYSLADAQRDKLELVSRKLGLRPGMRLLDVGCGWGSMALHAAAEHGAQVVGITVSRAQAEMARKRIAEAGLTERVEIRLQDYRDVDDGPYDAISSIGMAEHVGVGPYLTYARHLFDLLRPGGRLLNHQIARRPGPSDPDHESFISAYVFPDGELAPLGTTVSLIEEAGFEVRDVQALREHYALTLREWVRNLEEHWDEAVRLTSPGRARVWRLYMAGSALAFERNRIGVNHVLAVKPQSGGSSTLPLRRTGWLDLD